MDDPHPHLSRRVGRRLPLLANSREEVATRGALLAQELVAPVAVVPRSRRADHYRRGFRESHERLGQELRSPHPTISDASLFGRRPTPHYILSRQVNDSVYPFETPGIYLTRGRIPPDGVPRRATGARKRPHLMPPLLKSGDQRRANEPRRTANEYVQNLLLSPSRDEGMVARPREQVEDLAHKHEPPGTPDPALLVGKGGVSTGSSAYIMYAYTMCAHRWVVRN